MPIKIKYFGWSAFKISSDEVDIIFDTGICQEKPLVPVDEAADFICITHTDEHSFGNVVDISRKQKANILGNVEVIKKAEESGAQAWRLRELTEGLSYKLEKFEVTSFQLTHGPPNAVNAPRNSGFLVDVADMRIVHLGDAIGAGPITRQQVDILFVPVGGGERLDGKLALQALSQINPKLVIPMSQQEPSDAEYVEKHLRYFAPNTNLKLLKPGATVMVQWWVGKEFKISDI